MLLEVPGLLFFSTYTLTVLFWAEIYHQAKNLPTRFTSTRRLLSSDSTAGASPLTLTLANRYGQAEAEKAVSKPSKVQAILKNVKQVLHYAINSVIYRLSVPM
ncbi:hypothetical protein Hdeb2414_s0001g00026231 [Helianthus debilis subsp. tardiflorus]